MFVGTKSSTTKEGATVFEVSIVYFVKIGHTTLSNTFISQSVKKNFFFSSTFFFFILPMKLTGSSKTQ